ncbi:11831_t:CDS:1, partial [Racocetra fulgida]
PENINDLFEEVSTSDTNSQVSQETNTIDLPSQSNYRPRRTKSSAIWPYFDTETAANPGDPVCLKCKKVFSKTTSISTLRRHLNKHKIMAPARRQTILRFPRTDPYSDNEQRKRNKKLITWIIADQQPFTVVENQHFNEFIHLIDPQYIVLTQQAAKTMIIDEFE